MTDQTAQHEKEIARTVVNRIATARGLTPPWPDANAVLPSWLANVNVSGWGVVELGEMRLRLADRRQRDKHGQVYTPPEVVGFQIRAALDHQLATLVGHPRPLDHITVHDPFAGCGIYLIHSARHVARWRLAQAGASVAGHAAWVGLATAEVLETCIYGNDLDETAVDLARAVCWLEIDGIRPITFMDDNITVGDTFLNQLPAKLLKRWPLRQPTTDAPRVVDIQLPDGPGEEAYVLNHPLLGRAADGGGND